MNEPRLQPPQRQPQRFAELLQRMWVIGCSRCGHEQSNHRAIRDDAADELLGDGWVLIYDLDGDRKAYCDDCWREATNA